MANTKNAQKAQRQADKRRLDNRLHAKTTRNLIKKVRTTDSKSEATKSLPEVIAKIDKLAKKNVIHKNKAANLKSKLMKKVNSIK
jgi:small subunit ribosomal protein S20